MVGVYILIADYESSLGEVEYGFKVEVRGEQGLGISPPSQPSPSTGEGTLLCMPSPQPSPSGRGGVMGLRFCS